LFTRTDLINRIKPFLPREYLFFFFRDFLENTLAITTLPLIFLQNYLEIKSFFLACGYFDR